MKRLTALEYLDSLRAQGVSNFTTEQIRKDLTLTEVAAPLVLWRLRRKVRIATPIVGYHVIVPPEYRAMRCVPADQFIDGLMNYLKEPYYVGLLSAAEIHGAAHQHPQIFQVMVGKKRRSIKCGDVRIEFYVRRNVTKIRCVKQKVQTGYLRVSSPEATAFDLIGYMRRSAGLDNVATVLVELEENLDKRKLAEAAELSPIAWAQRLGALLQLLGKEDKSGVLAEFVQSHARKTVPFVSWKSAKGAEILRPWRVALNERPEADSI